MLLKCVTAAAALLVQQDNDVLSMFCVDARSNAAESDHWAVAGQDAAGGTTGGNHQSSTATAYVAEL